MGFMDAINNIKKERDFKKELQQQKDDHDKEIAKLKEQLRIANAEKAKMQEKINVLEKSAETITDKDVSLKQNYELHKIIENFKTELSKIPPLDNYKKITYYQNLFFSIFDKLVIPLAKEFNIEEILKQTNDIQIYLKVSAIFCMYGVCVKSVYMMDDTTNDLNKRLQDIVSLSNEVIKDEAIKSLNDSLIDFKHFKVFAEYIRNKSQELGLDNGEIRKSSPEVLKHWLEFIITIGSIASDFCYDSGNNNIFRYGIRGIKEKDFKEFKPHNINQSTKVSNDVYSLLVDLSEKFGIDLSKMLVSVGGYNICEPFYSKLQMQNVQKNEGR